VPAEAGCFRQKKGLADALVSAALVLTAPLLAGGCKRNKRYGKQTGKFFHTEIFEDMPRLATR